MYHGVVIYFGTVYVSKLISDAFLQGLKDAVDPSGMT